MRKNLPLNNNFNLYMNPLLISGVVSLGGKLINSVFGQGASSTVKAGFEQELNKAQQPDSGLL